MSPSMLFILPLLK